MSVGEDVVMLSNCSIVDGQSEQPAEGMHVLIRNNLVEEVSDNPISANGRRIDLRGLTLMPGLIDCHVHVVGCDVNLERNALLPNSLVAARSVGIMRGMLMRGFTTVRDLGGADFGLQQAIEEGTILGPRLIICGKAISQTGGHCDYRGRYDIRPPQWMSNKLGSLGRICDGVDGMRMAVREEIKGGAQFIKVMANGGVATPTDPVNFLGFSRSELQAAVEEAAMAQTYVAAHLYTSEGIRRALECGIRCVEHPGLVDAATAEVIVQAGAVTVPILIILEALKREGSRLGMSPVSVGKIDDVRIYNKQALQHLRNAGAVMGFGTDLIGELHHLQSEEFLLRGEILPCHEVIRSATRDAAKVLGMEGKIGCVSAGAFADLIAVKGNPIANLALLTEQGKHIPLIMKNGSIVKNELGSLN